MIQRLIIFCEGQTEEAFVRDVLAPYFVAINIFVTPIIFLNSSKNSRKDKGGITNYTTPKMQITDKCLEDSQAIVTTLVDYYGLPDDWVGLKNSQAEIDIYNKAQTIEQAWYADINCHNFIPNLLLHEFEALLFSDIEKFEDWFEYDNVQQLADNVSGFDTPEHINNSKTTAPSKRIYQHLIGYQKPVHGSLIAQEIGLDRIRNQCKHFDQWIVSILDKFDI